MLALFAVGVVSGTILSFELGILWPEFMATFGDVFGLGFALEGFSFFVEAIFIAIYVYGWDRLSPRVHFLTGDPDRIAGITGSLFVLAVNGWMNNPTGFRLVDGRAVDVRPVGGAVRRRTSGTSSCTCYLAAYMVAGFVRRRRLRLGDGCAAGATATTASALVHPASRSPRSRPPVQLVVGDWAARDGGRRAAGQARRASRASARRPTGRADAPARLVLRRRGDGTGIEIPQLLSLLARARPDATVEGLDAVPAGRTAAGQRRADRLPDDGRHRHGAVRCSAAVDLVTLLARGGGLPRRRWFYRGRGRRPARWPSSR